MYAYTANLHGPALHPALARLAVALLWVAGAGVVAAATIGVAREFGRADQINHVSGAWTGLAMYVVDEGVLYPPLYDDETQRYGGTRFGPLSICLNAFAARVTGEFVRSGKFVAASAMIGLLGLLYVALRRAGCAPAVAWSLVGCVILSHTALRGSMQIRGDTIPCALQLAALLLMWGGVEGLPEHGAKRRRSQRARLHLAAVLCALAVAFKLSAIWGTCAIGLWLLATDRRQLAVFCIVWWIVFPALAIGFHLATDGRMVESMFGLTTAGLGDDAISLRERLLKPVQFIYNFARPIWPLLPLIVLSIATAAVRRIIEPGTIALACALGILLIVLWDSGAQYNHLLDVVVLAPLPIGWLWRRAAIDEGMSLGQGIIAAVIAGALVTGVAAYLPHPYRDGGGTPVTTDDTCDDAMAPFRCALEGKSILAEDPYIPVSLGEIPVVLDPWMLQRIDRARPELVDPLIDRIRAREFDAIVVFRRVEDHLEGWYTRNHFGRRVADAIVDHYAWEREVRGEHIYVPREAAP